MVLPPCPNPQTYVGDLGSIPGLGRYPWRREQLPTPAFWPGGPTDCIDHGGHQEWT